MSQTIQVTSSSRKWLLRMMYLLSGISFYSIPDVFSESLTSGVSSSGIPFNFPGTRFCMSCVPDLNLLTTTPLSQEDVVCKTYISNILEGKEHPTRLLNTFLEDMAGLNKNNTWVFFSSINARLIYERIFREEYTFRIVVDAGSKRSESCVHAYVDGKGFIHRDNTANFTQIEKRMFHDGLNYETMYVNAIVDMWTLLSCNETLNTQFVKRAQDNLIQAQNISSKWDVTRIFTPRRPQYPKYTNISLPYCGQKTVAPLPPSPPGNEDDPCEDVYCGIEAKRAKVTPTVHPPEVVTIPDCQQQRNIATGTSCNPDSNITPRIFINEFVANRPDISGRNEFLELRRYPHIVGEAAYINNHKIVAFTAHSRKLHLVVNIHQQLVNQFGYFAVLVNTSASIQAPQSRKYQLLSPGDKEPIVLLLLQQNPSVETKQWQHISLTGKPARGGYSERNLNKKVMDDTVDLIDVMAKTVIDGYMYGIATTQPIENKIKNLVNVKGSDCNCVLQTGNPNNWEEDLMSLNACPIVSPAPFDKARIKLGRATPNLNNDCIESRAFQLEKVEQPRDGNNKVGGTKYPEDELECTGQSASTKPELFEIDKLINYEIRYIQKVYNKDYQSKFYPIEKFKHTTWPNLNTRGFDPRRENFPDITPYEIVPRSDRTLDIPFLGNYWRCEACYKRVEMCGHSVHHKSKEDQLAQKEGRQIPTQNKDIQRYLGMHVSRSMHYLSVLYSVREDRRRLDADARTRSNQPENAELTPMANLFLISFTMVKTNSALRGTETWMKTLSRLNTNIGTGVRLHSRAAVRSIILFMSDEGFARIISYMVEKDLPFTLILDGATDRTHSHYISLYLQSSEGEDTLPYFVGLIVGGKSSTSEVLQQSIQVWVQKKGESFRNYFIRRIVGCATDSAPNMVKLQKLINEWVNSEKAPTEQRPLIQTYCLAHKLNLASRSAMIPLKSDKDYGPDDCLKYLHSIERFLQTTYTWISLAQRRIGEFRETMATFKQPIIELQELHVERWIASEHRTIKHFLGAWITTMETMKIINEDNKNYKINVRNDALEFSNQLTDKQKLITVVFLQDFTAAFKKWSEILQYFVGLLSDQMKHYNVLLDDLVEIKNLRAPVLASFLKSCKCSSSADPNSVGCATVAEYEESATITWRGRVFSSKDSEAPSLTVLAPALIEKALSRIDHYISKDLMTALYVLSPENFPIGENVLTETYPILSDGTNIPVYAKNEIEYLATKFGMEKDLIVRDWAKLFLSILRSPSWDVLRDQPTTEPFWSRALRDANLEWTDASRLFIRTAKTISTGSTMVEFGFSVFNNIKNQRRSQMNDDILTATMNLVINFPSDVEHLQPYTYAQAWKEARRVLPSTDECTDEMEDDSILADPLGVSGIDDELIIDEEEPPNFDGATTKPKEINDGYDTFRKEFGSPSERLNRVRSVLL